MRLLDLFCGAGGAGVGYHRAGFEVVGVDIHPQPRYPFEFWQMDALDAFDWLLEGNYLGRSKPQGLADFDAIHASPPCPRYANVTPRERRDLHPDLYEPTRERLRATGVPWVIENVIGAPYRSGFVLCGSMFGLKVRRHRNFETSFAVLAPVCDHRSQGTALGVYGDGGGGKSTRPSGGGGTKAHRHEFAALMDMPWATPREIVQAIPPAYTQWIGEQLIAHIEAAAA